MHMRKALLLESPSASSSLARLLESVQFEVDRPAKKAWGIEIAGATRDRYDLVLVDLNIPHTSGVALIEQLREHNDVPVVFAVDGVRFKKHEKDLELLFAQPSVDWVRTPIDDTEFRFRINRATVRAPKAIETWNVPELRSDVSGRLDATLVADYFGWTLTNLSRALGRSVQAVHKTPDAVAVQPHLEKLERAALLGRRLVSADRPGFRKWLNTPSPELDGEKPAELLLKQPEVVVQWLEDAALGHPA
ncbi:MAG TPA: response regulator [Polyangia bacterium]|jgi:Response regulators consisting of a CheY-like receiver domain and a winged-helix DNA-binding domain|nr:response regulator [Polyangia bacterium]